jgi:uncharacterized repeat protein (TIGR01451 family)
MREHTKEQSMNHFRVSHYLLAFFSLLVASILLSVNTAYAAPTLGFSKTLVGSQTAFESGVNFEYELTWQCAGSISPEDDCFNMQIVDVLPPYVELVNMPIVAPVTSINVSGADDNPQTVTINFVSPVIAGATGSMRMTVRYRPGVTPDGLTSQNTATLYAQTSTGQQLSVQSSPPVVTTSIATDKTTATKTRTGGGAVDGTTTYRIRVSAGNGGASGALAITNITVTDMLPPGARFVSATPTPTSAPNPGEAGEVVWNWTGNTTGNVDFTVTVSYPAQLNNAGEEKTNEANVTTITIDNQTKQLTPAVTHTLTELTASSAFEKSFNQSPRLVGEETRIRLRTTNTGTATTDFVVEDVFPNELDVVRISTGANVTAVEYQKNGVNTWIPGVTTGSDIDVDSFPTFAPGDFVSALRFRLSNIAPGGRVDNFIFATVINPPHGGGPVYPLPHTVTNRATSVQYLDNVAQSPLESIATLEVVAPRAVVYLDRPRKTIVSGNPAAPTGILRWSMEIRALSGAQNIALINPVVSDLLPAHLEYAGNPSFTGSGGASAACLQDPGMQQIPNYNNTGRTLLIWSWAGTDPACTIDPGHNLQIRYDTRVLPGTPPNIYQNIGAIINTGNPATDQIIGTCGSGDDPYIPGAIDGSTDTVDPDLLCQSNPTNFQVLSVFVVESRKGVIGQLDDDFIYSGSTSVARTVRGGSMRWSTEIFNVSNIAATDLDVIDILPFNLPAPGNTGVGTGAVMGSTWTPFFLSEIDISAAPAGTTVYYSTDTNPCRPLIVAVPGCQPMTTLLEGVAQTGPGQWSTVLPDDPTSVRSFRINFGSYVLAPGATLRFEWDMLAPLDAPLASAGPDGVPATIDDTNIAWNTFGYSLKRVDNNQELASAPTRVGIIVQAPPVELSYSIGNRVWLDNGAGEEAVAGNGIQDGAEPGIAGVRVSIFADTNRDGQPDLVDQPIATVTTDASGYYRFDQLVPGPYVVRIDPINFAEGGPLAGLSSSPGHVDANTNLLDQRDNGIDTETPKVTGVLSAVIVIGEKPVPLDEVDNQTPGVYGPGSTTGEEAPNERTDLTVDFGFFAPFAQFGDRVWIESDKDGIAATGVITPVAGMVITGTDGINVYTTTTDAQGYYSFTVAAGTYTVTYGSVPSTYGAVTPSESPLGGSASGNAGVYKESGNPDKSRPQNTVVTVGPGEANWTIDFAFTQDPKAIILLSFRAVPEGESSLRIEWVTGAETNSWGFHLWRSEGGNRADAIRITPSLILATGGSGQGARYNYVDPDVRPGIRYTYWLQEVETGGATPEYGPITGSIGLEDGDAPLNRHRLFLPQINGGR